MLPTTSNATTKGIQTDDENAANEEMPTSSSVATNYHSVAPQSPSATNSISTIPPSVTNSISTIPPSATNSIAPQNSNNSFYDGRILTPPDLPSDEELSCYNPNQPRYCVCNQISYGDMIACDNKACPYEWFHFSCVGVMRPPKGKWYCPLCKEAMPRSSRRGRKRKISLD